MYRAFFEGEFEVGQVITLSSEDARHLSTVLRLKTGASVQIFNGVGGVGEACLEKVGKGTALARIESTHTVAANHKVSIVFGLSKAPAVDFIVRRCTELGVRSFQPLKTQNSQSWSSWNAERWRKMTIETSKQCQENNLPIVETPLSFEAWLEKRQPGVDVVVCDENKRDSEAELNSNFVEVVIGAEGGWSEQERVAFDGVGVHWLGLGVNRLRTETAALVGATLIKEGLGEL